MKYENKNEAISLIKKIERLEKFLATMEEPNIRVTLYSAYTAELRNVLDIDQTNQLDPFVSEFVERIKIHTQQEIAIEKAKLETL